MRTYLKMYLQIQTPTMYLYDTCVPENMFNPFYAGVVACCQKRVYVIVLMEQDF